MASPDSALPPVSAEFAEAFSRRAGPSLRMTFESFMELALYDEQLGYYRREKTRVGRGPESDFYTATSSGALFGELIVAACMQLLGTRPAADFTFVELGAEPERSILDGIAHPFAASRVLRVGEPLTLSGLCIVFSNELFDAQPFRRFIVENGQWRELGVELTAGIFREIKLGPAIEPWLPPPTSDGVYFDAPRKAVQLLETIVAQRFRGLFLALDYGKTARELAEAAPAGTARAYYRHTQSNDLLARPGEQDLTCHVCWDWLRDALAVAGFDSPQVESQEAFFVHHSAGLIEQILEQEAARLSPRKLSLMQLLHPGNMGQKFQVLTAARW